jgi:hypothetical protein
MRAKPVAAVLRSFMRHPARISTLGSRDPSMNEATQLAETVRSGAAVRHNETQQCNSTTREKLPDRIDVNFTTDKFTDQPPY